MIYYRIWKFNLWTREATTVGGFSLECAEEAAQKIGVENPGVICWVEKDWMKYEEDQ